jgi:recombinational DNA repair protein RecT
VAAIGLSLNPAEKLAYLIPRNVKVGKSWESRVYLEPSYMGLIRLATNSGGIAWIQAAAVKQNDSFKDVGMGQAPLHEYEAFGDRGDVVGVYAVAKTKDGDYLTEIMTLEEVHKIRDRSESYKKYQSGTWVTDFIEMAKKAVIRRLFKTLPRTDENSRMAMAVEISNENEGFEPIINNPDIGQYTANQKETFDKIISDGDAFGMFVFSRTIDRGVFDNLYHSFEKGTKGKYQKIIDSLNTDGAEVANEYAMSITEMANRGDVDGYKELINPLTNDDLKVIDSLLDSEVQMIVSREFSG